MTAPRHVVPGTCYLVTRRCSQRQFLLRPSELTNQIFLYVLALASARFGVLVHAYCVLSNHYHLVVTDADARLPAFGQYLDSLVARAMNVELERCESFWSPQSYSAVALLDARDVVDKAAYTLANPVAAGLVRRGRDWPGLWSRPDQVGTAVRVSRPQRFFRSEGMPDEATLLLTAPRGFDDSAEFVRQLSSCLDLHEGRAILAVTTAGREFLGAQRVLQQMPTQRPAAPEARRSLNPRFAGHDKWKRIEALRRLKDFSSAYRSAWTRFSAGVRDVVFPSGTYWMRVALGVRCAGAAEPMSPTG